MYSTMNKEKKEKRNEKKEEKEKKKDILPSVLI